MKNNTTTNQATKLNKAQALFLAYSKQLPKLASNYIKPLMINNKIAYNDGKMIMQVLDLRAFIEVSKDGTQVIKNEDDLKSTFCVVSSTILNKHFGENVSEKNYLDDVKSHLCTKDGKLKEFISESNIRSLYKSIVIGNDTESLNKGFLKTLFGDLIQHESVLKTEKEEIELSKDQQKTVQDYAKVKEFKKTEQKRKVNEKATAELKELGF